MRLTLINILFLICLAKTFSSHSQHFIYLHTKFSEVIDMASCKTSIACHSNPETGNGGFEFDQKNNSYFCYIGRNSISSTHKDFETFVATSYIIHDTICTIAGVNNFYTRKTKVPGYAEFDPFDKMWILSNKLVSYNIDNYQYTNRGILDSIFWNPYNSLNWRNGAFYFIAQRAEIIMLDTTIHGYQLYGLSSGKASIARLDTNDANNSIILFDYPDTNAVIRNMFSIRVDCDSYRTFVIVDGKGLEEVDFDNQTFIPYCDFELTDDSTGGAVPNGTWESCDINLDLDLDDDSRGKNGDYIGYPLCLDEGYPIVDGDFDLYADDTIDSIHISIVNPIDGSAEYLQSSIRSTYDLIGNNTAHLRFINNDPSYFVDLRKMLKYIRYYNTAIPVSKISRNIRFKVFAGEHSTISWTRLHMDKIRYAGQDTLVDVCLHETIDLNNYLSTWAVDGGQWDINATDSKVTVNDTGSHHYLYILDRSPCTSDTAIITLKVNPLIEVSYTIEDVLCEGENNGTITITSINGGIKHVPYEIYLDGELMSSTAINSVKEGNHELEIKQGENCNWKKEVIINVKNELEVVLGDDLLLNSVEDSIVIIADIYSAHNTDIKWYQDGVLSSNTTNTLTLFPYQSTIIHVVVTDEDLCISYDTISIQVLNENHIRIPNTIIPDDEWEINRKFNLFCSPAVEKISSILIYNRWGNLVYAAYELEPNSITESWWDGTKDNSPVIGGSYLYKISIRLYNGESIENKGLVFLLR